MSIVVSLECPLCHKAHREPLWPSTLSIPWADCACSDIGFCLYHRHSVDPLPTRPDNKILEEKAAKLHEEQLKEYAALQKAFENYKRTAERLVAAQDALQGVVAQCRFNCDEESNCGICAIALEALKVIKDENNE